MVELLNIKVMEKPIKLTQIDCAEQCRHRYAINKEGITTHHLIAKYGNDTCNVFKNYDR